MALVVGSVTVNLVTGEETVVPGLASVLYFARKAAQRVPNKDAKKGCVVTSPAVATATVLEVDTSDGYLVGDVLGDFTYVDGTAPASVNFTITAIPDSTHFTISPAVPAGQTIPVGKKFGFDGTQEEWEAQVTSQYAKVLSQISLLANADASSIISYLTANTEITGTASISTGTSGLQRVGGVDTDPPSAGKTLPVSGTIS